MIGVSDGSQFNDEFEAQIGGPITNKPTERASTEPVGEFNVDHAHHVPLVATALTKDGQNMYGMAVDHRVPLEMEFNGSKHDITPFLYAHENAELPVMHDLVKGGMDAKSAYGLAHDKVANPTEAAGRFAYAAKNGLDPEEFNQAYYSHIKQASETAREPSDKDRHPDGHTTKYGLDEAEGAYKVAENDSVGKYPVLQMDAGLNMLHGGAAMSVGKPANENKDLQIKDSATDSLMEQRWNELRDRLKGPVSRGTIPTEVMTSLKGLGNLGFDRASEALGGLRESIKAGRDPKKDWDIHPEDDLMWKRVKDYLDKNP